jgi:hypothetical protein
MLGERFGLDSGAEAGLVAELRGGLVRQIIPDAAATRALRDALRGGLGAVRVTQRHRGTARTQAPAHRPGPRGSRVGHAYRIPANWAVPLRAAGASLVQDLHPSDRGPHGTHHGAVISNGSLYCPQAPRVLLKLGPLARDATREQVSAHHTRTAELARCKPGRITSHDQDGYHRVMCPAVMGKIRCPLRPPPMTLDRDRPQILTPPQDPPACCTQQTITVPPEVTAKTAQKHDYPSAAHRRSYNRRTGAERAFATIKDPATSGISRGWCRLMGLAPRLLFTTCTAITRNQRITAAWDRRQEDNSRRAAAGLPPRTRRRRRKTLATLVTAPP